MKQATVYIYGYTPVSKYVGKTLTENGIGVVTSPGPQVTHLLLGVPNRLPQKEVEGILSTLPDGVSVIGGRLDMPGIDLLKDPQYLEANAAITAYCALIMGLERLHITAQFCPTLVIGWGRIGKRLARLLKLLGADVTVASSDSAHRAEAIAMGMRTADSRALRDPGRFRLVYNTAPAPIITETQARQFREDCVILDLASVPGIAGIRAVAALGLPGKMAPESSGRLIGQTLLRILKNWEETQ